MRMCLTDPNERGWHTPTTPTGRASYAWFLVLNSSPRGLRPWRVDSGFSGAAPGTTTTGTTTWGFVWRVPAWRNPVKLLARRVQGESRSQVLGLFKYRPASWLSHPRPGDPGGGGDSLFIRT